MTDTNGYNGFQKYPDIELEIDEILKDEETQNLRNILKKVGNEYAYSHELSGKDAKHFVFRKMHVYAIAASIAIIIGIFGVTKLIIKSSASNLDSIFTEYYQPYQSDFASRSDEVVVNNLYLGFQSYESKDYDKAVELFSKVINSDETILMAYFYRGISSIETGDYKLAIESFKRLLVNGTNPYYSQARWYTALTWIKLNNTAMATPNLEWLVSNDRYYGVKAKEILGKIKK